MGIIEGVMMMGIIEGVMMMEGMPRRDEKLIIMRLHQAKVSKSLVGEIIQD